MEQIAKKDSEITTLQDEVLVKDQANQLKDSEYHNQVDSFQKMIERDYQDLMSKV